MSDRLYRDKIRVRVNGLLVREDAVLLVRIHSPVIDKLIWTPPGGGLELGENMEACLKREFKEETGLEIDVGSLRYINEMIKLPFHAIEFYWNVTETGGSLTTGIDPEHQENQQLIKEVRWIPLDKLGEIDLEPSGLVKALRDHGKDYIRFHSEDNET